MSKKIRTIEPEDWFPKYRHISIEFNKDFDISDPFKNVERISPNPRSIEIHISPSFDEFGQSVATKTLREVLQCVGNNIKWLAIQMNPELVTNYLDVCAEIFQNVSGLAIELFNGDTNLKEYKLTEKFLHLKTLSLRNCFNLISNIKNWPLLKKFSIREENDLYLHGEIENFINNNKHLKSLNLDGYVLDFDGINGWQNLQELKIHNAYLSLHSNEFRQNLLKLQNVSQLQFYDIVLPNPKSKHEAAELNLALEFFASSLSGLQTLKHLTVTLQQNGSGFNFANLAQCRKLESLTISAHQIDKEEILHFVRHSRNLTTLHLHSYDGKFSNVLIRKIAKERAKAVLKDKRLNLFVGGKHEDFTEIAKKESIQRFITVIKCTECGLKDVEIESDEESDSESENDLKHD